MLQKQNIKDFTLAGLTNWLGEHDQPSYRARQVFQWLYQHRTKNFGEMTSLPEALRQQLDEHFDIGNLAQTQSLVSQDQSRKIRFQLADLQAIESVLMPNRKHYTACISSQVGCAMGCTFCLTAAMGLKRQLTTGEIVDQVIELSRLLPDDRRISNLVFMGMGEPLHNYKNLINALSILQANDGFKLAARRITISTSGLVPAILNFGKDNLKFNLAVSLNATTDELRSRIMPINRRWNIAALLDACRQATQNRRHQLTFEYILIKDMTDTLNQARSLVKLLHGIPCKINLIMYNTFPKSPYYPSSMTQMRAFQRLLLNKGLVATLRISKGQDILAACGQLATNESLSTTERERIVNC